MAEFAMCEECEYEYTHPETRRYDAQPVCCNDCGPQVYVIGREEKGADAIRHVRKIIRDGGIAAIKGIGGFHLCCDATSEATVQLLRNRKKRPVKPFAVMMRDMETVKRECVFSEKQAEVLDGHQKPIILLPRKEGGRICPAVAPGNPKVGVMLPYAPIQLLLFDYEDDIQLPDCLVMTSANTSGAPICRDDADAIRELSGLCDVILSNDRLIRLRADDTVMDFFRDEPYMIRRSRGYAPLPFMLKENWTGEVLAVGGELKNTFCVGRNNLFYPSPYIGDMGDVRTVRALKESVIRLTELLETSPKLVACDLHPGYNTTAAAEEMGMPLLKVQHHYAHILSCMAENDWNQPVIGVSFDGTGYGTDGTIWGGEFLMADYDGYTRMGSVKPFLQVGGDASAKEGWRIAVSLLREIYGEEAAESLVEKLKLCAKPVAKVQFKMAEKKINSVKSTSAGRLFDAVSAILGICNQSTFEGEASISLEFVAWKWEERQKETEFPRFPIHVEGSDYFTLETHSLVEWIAERRISGESAEKLAWIFHRALAEMIVDACVYLKEKMGITAVALSGGVYQNQLLLQFSVERLEEEGFYVLRHRLIPPNDGGICLGQAVAAMNYLMKKG